MATYYWIGNTNTLANASGNWSLTSGGLPQASVPDVSDTAILDGGTALDVVYSNGSPAFTLPNHGLADNEVVQMRAIGAATNSYLPAPFVAGIKYHVVATATNTFQLAASQGGAPIAVAGTIDTPTVTIYTGSKKCNWNIASVTQLQTTEDYTSIVTQTLQSIDLGSLIHKGGLLSTDWSSSTYYNINFANTTPALASNRKHILLGAKGRLHPIKKKTWTWTLMAASNGTSPLLFDSGEYPHIIIYHASTGYVSPQYSTMTNTGSEEVKFRSLQLKAGGSDIFFQPHGNPTDNDYKMKFTFLEHHNSVLGYQFSCLYGTFNGGSATWTFQASKSPNFLFPVFGYYNATYYGKSNTTGDIFQTYFHKVIIDSSSYGPGGVVQLIPPYSLNINELVVNSGAMLLGGNNSLQSTIRCRKTPIIKGSWNFSRINDGVYGTARDVGARLSTQLDVLSGGTGLGVLPKGEIMYGKGSSILHSSNFKYDADTNLLFSGGAIRFTESASTPSAVADGTGGLLYVKNTNPTTIVFVDDDGGETTLGAGGGGGGDGNTTYSISCANGDNTDEEKIRLTASTGGTDDVVLEAGTGLSIARSGDKITFTNTVTDTDTVLTSEQVQDIVGAMFDTNTETRIAATYVDGGVGAGKINLVVDDMTANDNTQNVFTASWVDSTDDILLRLTKSGASSGTQDIKLVAGSNITLSHTDANNFTIAATDTNTQLSDGDIAGMGYIKTDTNTQTTYTPSIVDSSNDALIRLTAAGAGSGTQDVKLVAGTNITLTPDTTTTPHQITIVAAGGGGGVSAFPGLSDTPANYSGAGGKLTAVNLGESALEFVPATNFDMAFFDETISLGQFNKINFAGAGVTATDGGSGVALITIPGGGGGGAALDNVWEKIDAGETATAQNGKNEIVVEVRPDGSGAPHIIPNMASDCNITLHNYARNPAPIVFSEGPCFHPATGGPHANFQLGSNCSCSFIFMLDYDGAGTAAYFMHSDNNYPAPNTIALTPL